MSDTSPAVTIDTSGAGTPIASSPQLDGVNLFDYLANDQVMSAPPPNDVVRDESLSNGQTTFANSLCSSKYSIHLPGLLPTNIPDTILQATDELTKLLKSTINKKLQLYTKHEENGKMVMKKVAIKMCDLSFPNSYASKLKSDKTLMKAIISLLCQAIDSLEYLILPELSIDVLSDLVGIFNKMNKCPMLCSIEIPFTAKNADEIEKYLPKVIGVLYGHLKPHSIECKPDTTSSTLINIEASPCRLINAIKLKVPDLKNLTYNGNDIISNDVNHRKRSLDSDTSPATPLPNKKSKQSGKNPQKKMKLVPFTKDKATFTFDSFLSKGELDTDSSFTAYTYWRLEKVHNVYSTTGKGTTIAIIDSGIDPSHPAFERKHNIIFQDFSGGEMIPDAVGHGTLCAGIACGNGFPYFNLNAESEFHPGVAPDARLVICKVTLSTEKLAQTERVLEALKWIHEHSTDIDVVSISLGSLQFSPKIALAITELIFKSIIVVCAASNLGYKYSQPISFPARLGHVLCIGSHGSHGKPSSFSPVGQQIDFLAPGENITGPSNALYNHHLVTDSGTSYATPAVAGLICLILSYIKSHSKEYFEQFNNQWVMKEILREISASPGRHSDDMGFGALNPLQFFQQPDRVLNSILNEVVFYQSDAM